MISESDPTEFAGLDSTDTEAAYAWAFDKVDDSPTRRLTPRRITTAAVAASLAAIAVAGGVAVVYLRGDQTGSSTPETMTPSQPPAVAAAPEPAPPSVSEAPKPEGIDAKFIADMRRFGVPISNEDPWWTVNLAHAICTTAHESPTRYPVGTSTVNILTKGVMENNPEWSWQQASRLTSGAVDLYCPDVWGPSQREIAAMPPDARYLAILQDRLGITPVDGSLVRGAHQVCDLKAQGWWDDKIVDAMDSPNPREDEQVMVETAVAVYCPQFR